MKNTILLFLISLLSTFAVGQELKIDVQVNAPRLVNADPRIFVTLEKQITEFLNNTKWTDDDYEDYERIEGSLNITITADQNATNFTADFFFQSIRPIYNSNYKSPLLNLVDSGVSFTYNEAQPIENNTNVYVDQLSSILTYYAYMMIAFDYDSFSPLGGDPYFNLAQDVVNSIPSDNRAASSGWQTNGNRFNKFWRVENMLNPKVRPMRQAFHEYYIGAMDQMTVDMDKSKAIIVSALTTIKGVNSAYPNSVAMQMFVDSKREEILEIFKGSAKGQQKKVYDIMIKLDPAQASEYNVLR
jgi:hypothetical protein